MQFGVGDIHALQFSNCEYNENHLCVGHILLTELKDYFAHFLHFSSVLDIIRFRKRSQNFIVIKLPSGQSNYHT
jgi:hypothetical protein